MRKVYNPLTTGEIMSNKDKVLKALQKSKSEYISGEQLSEKLGVSRAMIWKCVRALRMEGYQIDAVTNRGYALRRASAIRAKADFFVYDEIDSTNLQAKRLVLDGRAGHGSVAFAHRQTAGRGRLGRDFHSPKNGIYLSIVIHPDFDMSRSVLVTVAAAAAVAEAIDQVCGVETQVKWVNDIFVKGRKVCGILTEATTDFETGAIDNLIIGIGVNTSVRGFPKELRGVAGAVPLGGEDAKADLVEKIVQKTLKYVEEIGDEKTPEFMKIYRQKSLLIGKDILVFKGAYRKDPQSELGGIRAKATGIDDAGGLRVRYEDGKRETLTTGEVSVRL